MNNSKIIKSSKIIDRILRILQGFMIAFAAVSVIFIILSFAVGEKIVQDASFIELGNLTLYLSDGAIPAYPALRQGIVISLVTIIFMVAAGWYLLHVIRQILKPMKDGRPFETGVSSKVRKLAWTTLIGGAIIEACRVFGIIAELNAYDFGLLLNPGTVLKYSYNYSFNISFVVIAGILFFLSLCFRYGESLQQESDETL